MIKTSFGVGNIYKYGKNGIIFQVRSLRDLAIIIEHFDNYPLITQKQGDYLLFKQVIEIMNCQEHHTPVGLKEILNVRASINKGLSDELKASFPDTIPVPRPVVSDQVIKDPNWVSGFSSGEGCFYISITKSSQYKSGAQVKLRFQLTQHSPAPPPPIIYTHKSLYYQ